MRTTWQTAWGISFAVVIGLLLVGYLVSPEVMASHFDTQAPNGFMTRGTFLVFSLVLTCVVNGCYLPFGMRRFVSKLPKRYWNLPDKEWWFRPENRGMLYDRLVRAMAITGVGTNVVLGVVFAVVFGYNVGMLGIMWINVVAIAAVGVSLFAIVPFLTAFQKPDETA